MLYDVKKGSCDLYRVAVDGESATICVSDWGVGSLMHKGSYGGEILVRSSFGNFAHAWPSCGVPFREFLTRLTANSFFTKMAGGEQYDGEKTLAALYSLVLVQRRVGFLDAVGARELWSGANQYADEIKGSQDGLGYAFEGMCSEQSTARGMAICNDPDSFIKRSPPQQAVAFYELLWPAFTFALKQELAALTEVAADAAPTPGQAA